MSLRVSLLRWAFNRVAAVHKRIHIAEDDPDAPDWCARCSTKAADTVPWPCDPYREALAAYMDAVDSQNNP